MRDWSKPVFGVIRPDGKFEALPLMSWEDDPQAHEAMWVGGTRDAKFARAVLGDAATHPAVAQLLRFYRKDSLIDLIFAQSAHVEKLQDKLRLTQPVHFQAFQRVREG